MAASVSLAEAAAQLKADLEMLDAGAKEAAALLDRAAWSMGQLDRQVGWPPWAAPLLRIFSHLVNKAELASQLSGHCHQLLPRPPPSLPCRWPP